MMELRAALIFCRVKISMERDEIRKKKQRFITSLTEVP
jgi:flagellar biosynthesis regulator FlaF